jgi:hypothetical protein
MIGQRYLLVILGRPASFTMTCLSSLVLLFCQELAGLEAPFEVPSPVPGDWPQISGIYPHLAMFNQENECGTGAVVPWAGSLWVVTYAPHAPRGSSDKLYQISPTLQQVVRPESIGGTPANRLVHAESLQLFLGPYVIRASGEVRVLPYERMLGRPTGSARHLTDPAGKIYTATMEEGLYEIDVETLEVKTLFHDTQSKAEELRLANLPGYHGKGLYSGQGRLVYANNGEYGKASMTDPSTPSGVLAEWWGLDATSGEPLDWRVVRRNQFTEVTGPGGIFGAAMPDADPIWSLGWDHKSVILQLLDDGKWQSFRLPKGSHSYDGAHGWNTEWPRIREIGAGEQMLATMHGTFWSFPRGFRAGVTGGIRPMSNYLKVIGDFARWGDWVVFGCDDAAKSEFLNKRKAKGEIAGPGESQSNLWFVKPDELADLGPLVGRGAVWLNEDLAEGARSDPYLFSGYEHRALHLAHAGEQALRVSIEVDAAGTGEWQEIRTVELAPGEARIVRFEEAGEWVRLQIRDAAVGLSAVFAYRDNDLRSDQAESIFAGVARPGDLMKDDEAAAGGLLHARGGGFRTLRMIAGAAANGLDQAVYDLDVDLQLRKVDDSEGLAWTRDAVALPAEPVIEIDAASVLYIDDAGKRWRLPVGDRALTDHHSWTRVAREVCTERDLLNVGGTFFELPAENAGGFAKIRPIATHNRAIVDYASYRGMLVLAGIAADAPHDNPHIIRSDDGRTALWVGAVDDLWSFGKARGTGGPWKDTAVQAGVPSDPYLMTGYDQMSFVLRADQAMSVRLEIDVTGDGDWLVYQTIDLVAGTPTVGHFQPGFSAYWLRAISSVDSTATVQFRYE